LIVVLDESVHAIKGQSVEIGIHPIPLPAFIMSADKFFQHHCQGLVICEMMGYREGLLKVEFRAFAAFPELLEVFLEFVFGVFQGVIDNTDVVQFPLVVHVILEFRILVLITMVGLTLGDAISKRQGENLSAAIDVIVKIQVEATEQPITGLSKQDEAEYFGPIIT